MAWAMKHLESYAVVNDSSDDWRIIRGFVIYTFKTHFMSFSFMFIDTQLKGIFYFYLNINKIQVKGIINLFYTRSIVLIHIIFSYKN